MVLIWLVLVFAVALVTFTGGVFLAFHPLHHQSGTSRLMARSLAVGLFAAFGLNVAACWTASQTVRAYWQAQADLVTEILPEIEMYAVNHPGRPIPAQWVGRSIEPMFEGGTNPVPYRYVEVKAYRGTPNDYQWVAYTPEPFYQAPWSFIKPLGNRTRLVLLASGELLWLTEERFQELRPDIASPGNELAQKQEGESSTSVFDALTR
ncbi:hypothetical protein [Mucisphaera calidilacus]|uniref:Uncharacterized protein n=1 Tax=Mucisphaera calidilacus TaxID=2527982 RepID=A0A518BTQ7_9BACT|nr:hypothetical protein [Mucisphaera calidilacus]QDU70362.1 hypothetical protein Pan265_01880 [Mucisphaera calidilacus]